MIAIAPLPAIFNIVKLEVFQCPKPVIAAIHGGCIGGATSLVTACDIRYAAADAFFEIKVLPCFWFFLFGSCSAVLFMQNRRPYEI